MESLIASRFKLNASVNLIATYRICNGSTSIKSKCISQRTFRTSARLNHLGELSSGSYTKGPAVSEVFKKLWNDPHPIRTVYEMWRDEFKLFGREIKDIIIKSPVPDLNKGDIDMLFTFEEDAGVKKFLVITDKTNNQGYSTASFVRTQSETGLFSGFIDTRLPADGKTTNAGFASILTTRLLKSFKRVTNYDWFNYTHLVLKVRGDGRNYNVVLSCPDRYDITFQDQFHYPLYTRGGPYWQIAKIPFSNFYFTSKGRIEDQQHVMDLKSCSRVGITIADGITGPFKLEIEYIGLECQPFHKSICPYEHYAMKNMADL